MLRRLLENLEQAVGRFLHKCRGSEDGERSLRFHGRPVVGHVNHLPHLAQLDEQLRRVGRNDQQVRVGLDQDAGFFLVGLAQVVAGSHGRGHALLKICRVGNAGAVAADAAEVRQAVGFGRREAVDGLGQHQGQRVLACAARTGQDERMRKPLGAHSFAQVRYRRRIAEKLIEAHGSSLEHGGVGMHVGAPRPGAQRQL